MTKPTSFPPRLVAVTVDCADPGRLADFWSALLDVEVEDRDERAAALASSRDAGSGSNSGACRRRRL